MKVTEKLDTEIKIGKIIEEDKVYYIVEVDKDGNELDKYEIGALCAPYLDKEYVQFAIKYSKEI